MSRGVLPTQAYAMQNVQNLQKQEDAVQGAHSVTSQNMSTSHQFQTGPLTRLRGQQFQQRIVQQHQHTPMQDQAIDSLGNPEQLGEQIALAERQIEENRRKLLMYSPLQGQTQHVPHNANIQQLQTAKKEQAQVLKPVSYNMNKMQIPNNVRGNVSTQSPQSKTDVKLANSTGAPKRTVQQTKPRVIAPSNKRRKMCVQPESQNHTLSQSNNYQQIGNQNIPVIKGSNPASANMCQTIPTNQNRKTHPQNNSFTDCEMTPGTVERVELKGGGKFEEGKIYMVNNRKGQEKKMIWKGGELVNFKSTHTRETPFTEAFSTASAGHQYQTLREAKVVNADQSRTLHVSPRNQPPSLANVSMKQLDSPLMSRGVLPTQVYARQNVQKFPKQVHVAAVPNGHGGQSATNQNMSSSQQLQTGRLPFQLSQQRIFQQHQHSPLQDQAVVLQGNPKQLDEQIALAERQTEENRRNLLRYSPFPAQTQHVPHNANIKQLQTAKQKQDNGLKPAGYNLNKVQIPIKVRDNVITPSPQSNTDVKLVNRTGAPNRTIQQTNSQVMVSNKRRKLCVKQESQNPAFSQSTCFQQIGNQNIPVIKGSNPASANMCQTIQTKQNGKTHPQNNSFTDCEVTPGTVERVELKGGGKFEEGQIYMVRNRKGQEIKMIWKGGELVNFKSTVIPDGDNKNKKEGSKMKSSSVQVCRLKIFDLEKENKELKEQRLCKICMESDANVVFLPCGHLVSCESCAPPLKLCPICREVINKTVRTYLS